MGHVEYLLCYITIVLINNSYIACFISNFLLKKFMLKLMLILHEYQIKVFLLLNIYHHLYHLFFF